MPLLPEKTSQKLMDSYILFKNLSKFTVETMFDSREFGNYFPSKEEDIELKRRCGKKITQKRVYTLKQKRIRLKKSKLHNNFGEKRNKKGGKEK